LNSAEGKRLLAFVRGGDFAHPGEANAVRLILGRFAGRRDLNVLDVGCGRGGSAQVIQEMGLGRVYGLDLDAASIARAARRYPSVRFRISSATSCSRDFDERFDLMVLFNVFYALSDSEQQRCLAELRKLATRKAVLALFDYATSVPCLPQRGRQRWNPIVMAKLSRQAQAVGWRIVERFDLTRQYLAGYEELVSRIDRKRVRIIARFGPRWFRYAREFYDDLRQDIADGRIGGILFYLTPS
jgi:cyclopropane fatty-acyl-phospholipid synthase-like methyltransferase